MCYLHVLEQLVTSSTVLYLLLASQETVSQWVCCLILQFSFKWSVLYYEYYKTTKHWSLRVFDLFPGAALRRQMVGVTCTCTKIEINSIIIIIACPDGLYWPYCSKGTVWGGNIWIILKGLILYLQLCIVSLQRKMTRKGSLHIQFAKCK